MKGFILAILALGLVLLTSFAFAETYTGQAENVEIETSFLKRGSNIETPMGIKFEVVIKDEQGKEIARIRQYVSAGIMTSDEVVQAIKNVVERKTQDVYAHAKGAQNAIKKKIEIESFRASCNSFVPTIERPSPQDKRIISE